MKCTVHIQDEREEVVVYAKENSPLIEKIKRLAEADSFVLIGSKEDQLCRVDPQTVDCFVIQNGKTEAVTQDGVWRVKQRLYQLEDLLADSFIKINQSCLVNRHAIVRFKATLGGALQVVLNSGYTDYVSRRQLKEVKERMGL
ncbi:MAG: LytTR family transcriptional regulator [Clostridia bacterium]|nr:LytTR family transcriptional regulator [Clostridia bacterium]